MADDRKQESTETADPLRERGERFLEADAAMKAYEEAGRQLETFVDALRQSAKDLPWMREDAAAKVKDWAANLVPGVQSAKQMLDWTRMNLGGSMKYASAPYAPTPFSAMRDRLIALAGMEKAAIELKMTDLLRTNQRAVSDAEASLQAVLERMSLADQLAFAEIQQKILEQRQQTSA